MALPPSLAGELRGVLVGTRVSSVLASFVLLNMAAVSCRPSDGGIATLAAPSGPWALGTLEVTFVDESREEVTTSDPADRRELAMQLWYPTADSTPGRRVPYMPAILWTALESVFGGEMVEQNESLSSAAMASARPAPNSEGYPLVVFLPGSGMTRHFYTKLVQDLASWGFVVAAMDFTGAGYTVLSGARVVTPFAGWQRPEDLSPDDIDRFFDPMNLYLTEDVRAVVAKLEELNSRGEWSLAGLLDFERIGIVGHSLGGLVALRACATDPRYRACVNLDGVSNYRERSDGLTTPTMLIRAGAERADWFVEILTAPFKHSVSRGYDVLIDRATHESFSDLPLISPERYGVNGGTDALMETSKYLIWFLGEHLADRITARPGLTPGVSVTQYGRP